MKRRYSDECWLVVFGEKSRYTFAPGVQEHRDRPLSFQKMDPVEHSECKLVCFQAALTQVMEHFWRFCRRTPSGRALPHHNDWCTQYYTVTDVSDVQII